MEKKLIDDLRLYIADCKARQLSTCWISKEEMELGLKLGLFQITLKNVDQGDDTYKTTALFEDQEMVYVGERL